MTTTCKLFVSPPRTCSFSVLTLTFLLTHYSIRDQLAVLTKGPFASLPPESQLLRHLHMNLPNVCFEESYSRVIQITIQEESLASGLDNLEQYLCLTSTTLVIASSLCFRGGED